MSVVPNLTVGVRDRAFSRTIPLNGVKLSVESISHASDWGPKFCRIRVDGSLDAINKLLMHLRTEVTIRDGAGREVWWGCWWSTEIYKGKIKYGLTLDGMANKINVVYLQQTINQEFTGAGTQAETGFSSDTNAIADFGTFEMRVRAGNLSSDAAIATRTRELSDRAKPQSIGITAQGSGEVYAIVTAWGWKRTLGVRYYANSTGNAAGFEQNAVITSEADQPLGVSAPAKTTIAFHGAAYSEVIKRNSLEDESSTLVLSSDSYVFVEGSTSGTNDLVWQMAGSPQGGRVYTLTTPPAVTEQAAGASVTVKVVGQKIWETFTLTSDNPFAAAAIDIRVKKYRSPTDNVLVKLYSVTGGLPDTLLATGTITNAEVQTFMAWATAVLDSAIPLTFGTTYGILVERSSPTTDYNGFVVGVDTATSYSGGSLKLYANSTHGYLPRPTNADLIFKVSGTVETTTQMTTIISSVGEFFTGIQVDDTSGIKTLPYRDGTETALQVIDALAQAGTSGNKRLLTRVDSSRKLVVYVEPSPGGAGDYILRDDGLLYTRSGGPIPPHTCPCSQWATVADLVLAQVPTTQVFIDEVEYRPRDGTFRIVRTRNRKSELSLTEFTQ